MSDTDQELKWIPSPRGTGKELTSEQHARRLNEEAAWKLKQIRHQRKSVEKLYRTIEFYDNDGTPYEWRLGNLLVAFYHNQPTKLYEVIHIILGPTYTSFPGNRSWKKEVNFEDFLHFKAKVEKAEAEEFYPNLGDLGQENRG